ncbi:MAG TPA: DMT family transporter [Bacteroidota bacterium]
MNKRTKAELYLLSITFIWGSTFVVTKFVLRDAGPFLYTFIRFVVAALIFTVIFLPRLRTIGRSSAAKGAILGVLLFIGFATQTVGLLYTTASNSAFITGMMVVFTPICQLLIERKPPRIGNIVGVALVTVGLYFLTSPTGASFNIGDGLTLLCALSFGFYIVYLDIFSQDCEAVHLTFMQFVTTAVLAGLSFFIFEDFRLTVNFEFTAGVLYLAVFATVVALFVQAKYQKDTTPTRSAVVFSTEPVIAGIVAYVVLNEHLGNLGILGAGLITAGVLVSEFSDSIFKSLSVSE